MVVVITKLTSMVDGEIYCHYPFIDIPDRVGKPFVKIPTKSIVSTANWQEGASLAVF